MNKTTQNTSDHKIRADLLLAKSEPSYSRSALSKLFELKLIKINHQPVQPGDQVQPNQILEYNLAPLQQKPEVIDLPIFYQDENIIVINKPAGIISHARGRFWQEASVASFIRDKVSSNWEDSSVQNPERAGIVHRLDRSTSGVIVCAKNPKTLSELQKSFQERQVQKQYLALVENCPKQSELLIDAAIARNPKRPTLFMVDPSGKPAQTYLKVLHQSPQRSLLLLKPKTGRTHQLRVHLDYINSPIIGDPFYGPNSKSFDQHGNSLRLHAYSLKLADGRQFKAPIPEYWQLSKSELAATAKI